MEITYLSPSTLPSNSANSVHVMKMCAAFVELGHDVSLWGYQPTSTENQVIDPFEFYGITPTFDLHRVNIPISTGDSILYGLRAGIAGRFVDADLVYGRALTACMVAALLGQPVVFEAHEPPTHPLFEWFFRRLIKSGNLKQLVVISDPLRRKFKTKYNMSKSAITVAYDAADDPPESTHEQIKNADRLQVGYIGQLYPGKGMSLIADLIRRCQWADFHIVGGSDDIIKKWRAKLRECDNVTFHGFIRYADTHAFRQSFDIALAPYQRRVESDVGNDISQWMSPLKIFEYMAASVPILASDLPAIRSILENGKTGLLCPPDEPKAWTAALERFYEDHQLRAVLSRNAREQFESTHMWSQRAERILSLI